MLYDGDTFTEGGLKFRFTTEPDTDSGPPWEESDGHGEVSDWTTRAKRPGEFTLSGGRYGSRRFYDFAGACKLARADGWGFLPGDLKTELTPAGTWRAWCKRDRFADQAETFESIAPEINAAIRAVYDKHRATLTARQYAAGAAGMPSNALACPDLQPIAKT